MKKKIKRKRIHTLTNPNKPYTYMDLVELKPEAGDFIDIGYSEPYDMGNEASDGYFYLYVDRMLMETDEEFNRRLEMYENFRKKTKRKRLKQLLELKEEFKDIKIGRRVVNICDQGHYGSTFCSECGEDVENHQYDCPKCNCIFIETENN